MYPEELVIPMKEDLTKDGFKQLLTGSEVDDALSATGTTFLVINSVCGCAAANARPAAKMAVQHAKKPDHLVTVFAGVDKEAVDQARKYTLPYPPSSPAIALFRDGRLVHMLERHNIEGHPAEMIAENLKAAYEAYL